jgi:multicomponent Na+:H+ antiporter subunit G
LINLIAGFLVLLGLLFFTGGAVGIIRMPDFYSRLHPAGKLDTMGLFMSMLGVALYTVQSFSLGDLLTGLKIILIVVFVFITSPTATHAIVDAGVRAGLEPWTQERKGERP